MSDQTWLYLPQRKSLDIQIGARLIDRLPAFDFYYFGSDYQVHRTSIRDPYQTQSLMDELQRETGFWLEFQTPGGVQVRGWLEHYEVVEGLCARFKLRCPSVPLVKIPSLLDLVEDGLVHDTDSLTGYLQESNARNDTTPAMYGSFWSIFDLMFNHSPDSAVSEQLFCQPLPGCRTSKEKGASTWSAECLSRLSDILEMSTTTENVWKRYWRSMARTSLNKNTIIRRDGKDGVMFTADWNRRVMMHPSTFENGLDALSDLYQRASGWPQLALRAALLSWVLDAEPELSLAVPQVQRVISLAKGVSLDGEPN